MRPITLPPTSRLGLNTLLIPFLKLVKKPFIKKKKCPNLESEEQSAPKRKKGQRLYLSNIFTTYNDKGKMYVFNNIPMVTTK